MEATGHGRAIAERNGHVPSDVRSQFGFSHTARCPRESLVRHASSLVGTPDRGVCVRTRGEVRVGPMAAFGWRNVGPTVTGGRLAAIAGSNRDPALVYIGSAGGGV